jgi:hypothetical protein
MGGISRGCGSGAFRPLNRSLQTCVALATGFCETNPGLKDSAPSDSKQ